jgi:hypothetical protein
MKTIKSSIAFVVVCLAISVGASACGPDSTDASGTSAMATDAAADAGVARGGDAWCQSIVAMTSFMAEPDSFKALAGVPVPDGSDRANRLHTLVADMESKAPTGHDQDWVIYNQMYSLWEQQLAAPTKERLTDMQALAKSDAMVAAQANLRADILKACPDLKDVSL